MRYCTVDRVFVFLTGVYQAHTAIKNSGASQRETEARITQAHQELAAEQERMRRAHEDRAAAESRWAEEVTR